MTAAFYGLPAGDSAPWPTQYVAIRDSSSDFVLGEGIVAQMANTPFLCLEWREPSLLKIWAAGGLGKQYPSAVNPNLKIKFEGRFENARGLEDGCKGDFLDLRIDEAS